MVENCLFVSMFKSKARKMNIDYKIITCFKKSFLLSGKSEDFIFIVKRRVTLQNHTVPGTIRDRSRSSLSNTFLLVFSISIDLLHVVCKEEEHCMIVSGRWALCRLGVHYEAIRLSTRALGQIPLSHLLIV